MSESGAYTEEINSGAKVDFRGEESPEVDSVVAFCGRWVPVWRHVERCVEALRARGFNARVLDARDKAAWAGKLGVRVLPSFVYFSQAGPELAVGAMSCEELIEWCEKRRGA